VRSLGAPLAFGASGHYQRWMSINQSIKDFTVVGGQLAHLTNCGLSSENKTDKIRQTNEASTESSQEVVTVQSKLKATNCEKQELDSACGCHCGCIVSTRKPKNISVLKFRQVKDNSKRNTVKVCSTWLMFDPMSCALAFPISSFSSSG